MVRNHQDSANAYTAIAAASNLVDGGVLVFPSSYSNSLYQDRAVFYSGSGGDGMDLQAWSGDMRFYTDGYAAADERMRAGSVI